jgi:hypothetical protein
MRYFEDLQIGEIFTSGGLVVDGGEAADFARRYDPKHLPPTGIAYIHRGPEISPWQAAALSWKLLTDIASTCLVEEAEFTGPSDLQWRMKVSVGDVLRVEAKLMEMLPPDMRLREQGWARVSVTLITAGPAGFGAWGDDDQEIVEDVALTYFAYLRARRREEVSIYHGLS